MHKYKNVVNKILLILNQHLLLLCYHMHINLSNVTTILLTRLLSPVNKVALNVLNMKCILTVVLTSDAGLSSILDSGSGRKES